MITKPEEIKVLHWLTKYRPEEIHAFLDIDLIICMEACSCYRGIHENIKEQISMFPDRSDKLNAYLVKLEQKLVRTLIGRGQIHGLTESESQKFFANYVDLATPLAFRNA